MEKTAMIMLLEEFGWNTEKIEADKPTI